MSFIVPGEPEIPSPVAVPPDMEIPDLLSDLPPFEQDSYEIQGLLRAVSNELARIESMRQAMILGYFPVTSEEMLHLFEYQLGLPTDPPALTLTQRQSVVLATMRSLKAAASGADWQTAITGLVGPSWSYNEHDPADGGSPPENTLLVTLPTSPPQPIPTTVAATTPSGGTLTPGTYYYRVAADTLYGSTLASAPISVVVASGHQVDLTWDAQTTPTVGYSVYRGTSPTNCVLLQSVTVASFNDTGALSPGTQTPPAFDSSGSTIGSLVVSLIRRITPAHIVIEFTYGVGFIVGVSRVDIDTL